MDIPSDLRPAYQLTFTCTPCQHRSTHRITKHGYHKGTVLVQCPGCKARHVIADHLKVFMDNSSTLEDILMRANVDGKPLTSLLKKGKLGIRQGEMVGNEWERDMEFWEDGTETKHEKME
jgi:mitochondrial protein import protein ZIM17